MIEPVRLRWVFRGRPKVASTSLALVSGWLRRSQLHPQDVDLGRVVIIPLDRHLFPSPPTVRSTLEELFPLFFLTFLKFVLTFGEFLANFERPVLGCIDAKFSSKYSFEKMKALDEIYKIYTRLHLWNPIEKP